MTQASFDSPQPMEAAPRDGTKILISDGEDYAVASWDNDAVQVYECGWRDTGDMGWGGMVGVEPICWWPLPVIE